MGHEVESKCLDCGTTYTVKQGGGFSSHLVRCDKCGRTKSIGFDELDELQLRYLKGLKGPYCVVSSEHEEHVRKHLPVEPIDEYHSGINAMAGKCRCGGKYNLNTPPR